MSAGGPDVAAVVATVAEVARSFRFTPSPDLKRLQQQSEDTDYWFYRIVADYRRSDEGTGYSLIFITVAVQKQTGEVAVQIRDLHNGWQTDFTRGLEEALVQALAARFPSDRIEVKRKWSGPHVFGP
ncbi:hypothetical protein L6Q96_05790 [Candidatus Binatia bacterium]|nr:hypothetical protein [Candidatus Binatia bacterium]